MRKNEEENGISPNTCTQNLKYAIYILDVQGRPRVDWFDPYLPENAQLNFLSARCMAVYRVG